MPAGPSERREPMGQLLLSSFRWFDRGLLAQLHQAGFVEVRRSHSLLFAHLDRDGTRISELARRIGVTRQSVQQTVHELAEMGLVRLEPDPSNRSAKVVVQTAAGRRSVRLALETYERLEAELAHRIGRTLVASLRAALEADWGESPTPTK